MPYWFSIWMICPLMSGVLKSPAVIVLLSFLAIVSYYLLYILDVDGCIYVNEYNIFFLYWSLYHYTMDFFVFCLSFVLNSVLSDMSIPTLTFLSLPFAWNLFFYPISFRLCIFSLNWNCCRHHTKCLFLKSNQLPYVFWFEHLLHWHLKWWLIGMYIVSCCYYLFVIGFWVCLYSSVLLFFSFSCFSYGLMIFFSIYVSIIGFSFVNTIGFLYVDLWLYYFFLTSSH